MIRGYPMRRSLGLILAAALWAIWLSPALAESGSRYSAPLWTWIAAIVVAVGLSVVGLLIGYWFMRKRSRVGSSE
jgi:membrane protein implicated in regulation of membrane protease activity